MATLFVGIDVSKASVDVFCRGADVRGKFKQTERGLASLVEALEPFEVGRVVMEASGGYERAVLRKLHEAGLPCVLVQPNRVRQFARGVGEHAKTDAIDARVLAHMAEVAVEDSPVWKPLSVDEELLRALVRRRVQLKVTIDAENKRLKAAEHDIIRATHQDVIKQLKRQLRAVEGEMKRIRDSASVLGAKLRHLEDNHQGVALMTAATLVAELPELGTLTRGQAAALTGLAPYARESGQWAGRRFIRGGRANVRRMLFMSTLTAIRLNPHIQAFFNRLVANGKPKKLAIIACARKHLVHINSEMRNAAASWNQLETA